MGEHDAYHILEGKVDPSARYVWFHAASLGEFEQGRPLIEHIRKEWPEYKVLLTFFSPSGYEVRKDYKGADICCYLPIDTISNARRFLRMVRPEMAFFIKYEFWYNYLHILKHRGVPTYSVSSIFRPDQIFFKWYGRSYRKVLYCFSHFFVQNEKSRELLRQLNIGCVSVVGDTRFDRVLQIKEASKRLPIVEAFVEGTQGVFVAGSSWEPDEDVFIPYFNQHKEWKLIIAPHVVSEDHLRSIEEKLNRKTIRYSTASAERASAAECLIVDCFGLLSSIYHYGTVAYVGGGFGAGIHNVLEAAVWGIPVIFGPENKHFQEAQELIEAQGGLEITDLRTFNTVMSRLIRDTDFRARSGRQAQEYVKGKAGAMRRIMESINV